MIGLGQPTDAFRPAVPERRGAAYARAEFRDRNAGWLSPEAGLAPRGERWAPCWLSSLRVAAAKVASVLL